MTTVPPRDSQPANIPRGIVVILCGSIMVVREEQPSNISWPRCKTDSGITQDFRLEQP